MKLNHLIIGSDDVSKSASFYCELFGFKRTADDPGAVGGQVLKGKECDLLILRFDRKSLPNPVHFAFEANDMREFEQIGEFKRGSKTFKNFYVSDPSNVNVEVMVVI